MADHATGGVVPAGVRPWVEPDPHGCEFYIPISPSHNAHTLAEVLDKAYPSAEELAAGFSALFKKQE